MRLHSLMHEEWNSSMGFQIPTDIIPVFWCFTYDKIQIETRVSVESIE